MIKYSLICLNAHGFEGWFSSGEDFDKQVAQGLLACPVCNATAISKGLMTPSVATARKKEEKQKMAMDVARQEAIEKLKQAVAEIRAKAEDVGEKFPEEARKIHYGETEARGIIGQASVDEVCELLDEGIEIAPLPVLLDETN